LIPVESPLCNCCGIPFAGRQGQDHFCGACLASGNQFGIARAALVYNETATEIIHNLKYRGKIQLAGPLGELLLTAFRFFWDIDGIDMVLPVPLHPGRLRQRGFNQAYLLIWSWPHLAARYGNDLALIRIERDLLIRTKPTAPQSALGRDQRADNIKDAFDLKRHDAVAGKKILLIDDVYTTGATANECGRLLLDRGAQKVDVLTLARAV
jgi:ComF family protein